jgi:hypothetical protein
MSRGDLIVVRAYGDKPLIRRVWEVTDRAVYIHSEENYHKRKAGIDAPDMVGFPRLDAYVYDPETFPPDTEGIRQDAAFWAALQPYQGQPSVFTVGDKVRMLNNADFAGYVGEVVRLSQTRRNTRGYIHVRFPGHPWQTEDDDFGLDPWELEKLD